MKTTLLVMIFTLMGVFNGFGQSQKNDLNLTVAVLPLIGSSDDFESGVNGFVIKPSVGYFITDKTSVDLNFSYATLNDLRVGNVDSYYTSYALSPTLRNNFVNKSKLRVFAEFGLGLGTIQYDADNSNLRTSQHEALSGGISILNIGFGGNYFFNDHFGIELIIPYLNTTNIPPTKPTPCILALDPLLASPI
jgi:hypothetical protein